MSKTSASEPLGLVLQKADLVSAEQVNVALSAQKKADRRRLGEILAARGWIKQETADFFVQTWPNLFDRDRLQPIGQYLKAAALLDEEQIQTILQEQEITGDKFGAIAVLKGWLRQNTIDFFVEHLELLRQWQLEKDVLLDRGITAEKSKQLLNLHDRLIHPQKCDPTQLLKLYKQIWQQGHILASGCKEELELLKIGLITQKNQQLSIADPIYQSVFDAHWVERELARLQPYSKIRLRLFNLEEKASLPYNLLTEVLYWTGNQPYLTQKLCQLLSKEHVFIEVGEEANHIKELVQTRLIDNWKHQTAADHLLHIEDRLLKDRAHHPLTLLRLYQQIWQQREIPAQNSSLEAELLNIGLIVKEEGRLKVANRIYQGVFNQGWIAEELAKLTDNLNTTGDRHLDEQQRHRVTNSARETQTRQNQRTIPLWIWLAIVILLLIPGLFAIAYQFLENSSDTQAPAGINQQH
jgi:hypothetical protein